MPLNFAADSFSVNAAMNVTDSMGVTGLGYGSEIHITTANGPILDISADNVVVENIRFVYDPALVSQTLITRPVRCSGATYSPTALGTGTTTAAIKVTGDNVTIRNCWFDGFDNAIYSTGSNTQVKCSYFTGGTNSSLAGVYLAGTYGHVAGCYMDELAYGVYAAGDKSSISDNTILATETGVFVTSDYNRIHGNYVEGHADGFALVLTHDSDSNTVTGNVALPEGAKGTHFFTTGKGNMYAANIGEVDLE